MKATQVKPSLPEDKAMKCDVCGKLTTKPYGYTRHGNGCVCSKDCDLTFQEHMAWRFPRQGGMP